MAKITVRNLSKQFSKGAMPIQALNQVSLTIPNGKTLAVLGPSGCGKSTLLRVLAGLDSDYEGQILFDGEDIQAVSPADRNVGMVFQNYALYPHFAGHGNLSFVFRVRGAPDKEAEERIRVTSEIMGIGFKELLRRKPGTLSGGQQQRLAIGRAIVRNPNLFLFDEPLSNLDAKLRQRTRVEIKRLLRKFGITAVYVTHDQVEAIALGDLIAVMRAGRVEQVGTYADLRENPLNTFVAGFLGNPPMNLLPEAMINRHEIQLGPFTAPRPIANKLIDEAKRPITLGIRPEAILLTNHQQEQQSGLQVSGQIEVLEPDFGRQCQQIHTEVAGTKIIATVPIDARLHLGETIAVTFPFDSLYFFNPITGMVL